MIYGDFGSVLIPENYGNQNENEFYTNKYNIIRKKNK